MCWARTEPLLPDRTPRRGGRWRDHRQVIDAIAFTFRTGTQWVHLPEKYGTWRGAYNRLRMWALDGTWERVFTALVARADADEDLQWAVAVDSTIVRAHQHAAGARTKGPGPRAADHAIGRSHGGPTTKIHLAADGNCRPLAFRLTAGQAGDAPAIDREAYKQRNTVERCINCIKHWPGLATRYDKTATIYLAGLHIAGIFIWSAR
ncbi:IS5 family transposase [Streptomyces sp. 4N509B]|uniref:IS5 family transposase n=1 Tax=Streptomyces sp. 4N509B TaxID=3457413 RepID=UPI003FD0E4E2